MSTVAGTGAARIAEAFSRAKGRAALMPYLMGGYPDVATCDAIAQAYADGGADLVELGVPFSDPIADGPVIQAAGTQALAGGAGLQDVLGIAERLAPRVPVVLMTYVNIVLARGVDVFAAAAASAGVSGVIVPDLPLEEAPDVMRAFDAVGLALVPLVAPTTNAERMARIGARAQGFVYTVSLTGITGERASLSDTFAEIVARAKAHTDVPVALGFGISTPEQASAAASAGADGVIVGSRLVRAAGEAEDPAAAVRELVAAFARALR